MKDWSLTGLAVAVVKDDKIVFSRGYGVRDIRTKEPIDENTIFQLGSCSKPLAASGVALLVQNGKLDWNTPIIKSWPEFQVADPHVTKQATLRDILCHRTGVGKDESGLYYEMPTTRSELLGRLSEVQQAAPFRTEFRYSNLMYSVAGRVVEHTTDCRSSFASQTLVAFCPAFFVALPSRLPVGAFSRAWKQRSLPDELTSPAWDRPTVGPSCPAGLA